MGYSTVQYSTAVKRNAERKNMLDTYVGVLLAILTVGLLNAIQTLLSRKKRAERIDDLLAQIQDQIQFDEDEEES